MTPLYKTTITHPVHAIGGTVVDEPLGLKEAELQLERDPDFHSLVETFDGTFVWWGSAYTLLKTIKASDGPKGRPEIKFEITFDGLTYDTLFVGLIDLSLSEDITKISSGYKMVAPVIRNDFWAKFINRKNFAVDLQAAVDVDGNARTPIAKITLPLPCQPLRKTYNGFNGSTWFYSAMPAGQFGVISFDGVGKDEIETRDTDENAVSSTLPKPFITAKEPGGYTFDITIFINSTGAFPGGSRVLGIDCYIQHNGTATPMTVTQLGTNGVDGRTQFTATVGYTALMGDAFRVYFKNTSGAPVSFYWLNHYFSYLTLDADTTFPDSSTDAYLIGDAAESILSKIVGADGVQISSFFTGCIQQIAMARGKHIRGNLFSDPSKKFTLSFNEWWECWAPVLNMAMGYTKVAGVDKMEIGLISDFYNPATSLNLSGIPNIVTTYDLDKLYRSLTIGFQKWAVGSYTSIDDPQTKHEYINPDFATIGREYTQLSKAVMASLAIEQTRRMALEPNVNWQLDEDIIGIALNALAGSPTPEVGGDFAAITNLLNASTRYNIRHSVARIFKRNRSWFQCCLVEPAGTGFNFASGEGNLVMTQQFTPAQCEAVGSPDAVLTENQNMAYDGEYIFIPEVATINEAPMSWADYKTIVANRHKAVGISASDSGHVSMFIESLSYKPFKGNFNAKLLKATV